MKNIRFLPLVGALCLLAMGPLQAGIEYVQNGSFENGSEHWTKAGSGNGLLEFVQVQLPERKKANAFRAVTDPAAGQSPWDNSVVNALQGELISGKQVTLSFWARSPEGAKMGIALQPFAGSEVQIWEKEVELSGEWQRFEFAFPLKDSAAEGAARLQFTVGYQKSTIEVAVPSLSAVE